MKKKQLVGIIVTGLVIIAVGVTGVVSKDNEALRAAHNNACHVIRSKGLAATIVSGVLDGFSQVFVENVSGTVVSYGKVSVNGREVSLPE